MHVWCIYSSKSFHSIVPEIEPTHLNSLLQLVMPMIHFDTEVCFVFVAFYLFIYTVL